MARGQGLNLGPAQRRHGCAAPARGFERLQVRTRLTQHHDHAARRDFQLAQRPGQDRRWILSARISAANPGHVIEPVNQEGDPAVRRALASAGEGSHKRLPIGREARPLVAHRVRVCLSDPVQQGPEHGLSITRGSRSPSASPTKQ